MFNVEDQAWFAVNALAFIVAFLVGAWLLQ
jgi:hypothetical protein